MDFMGRTIARSSAVVGMGLAFAVAMGAQAGATSLEDAVALYKRGDYETAAPVFERLARAGDPKAEFWLGSMWHNGKGRPVNYETALRLYGDAALAGNADAQNNLALLHRDGKGVEPDLIRAYAWFSLAAAQDHSAARTNLSRLRDRLTSKEILAGQTMATGLHGQVTERRLRALRRQLAAASPTVITDEAPEVVTTAPAAQGPALTPVTAPAEAPVAPKASNVPPVVKPTPAVASAIVKTVPAQPAKVSTVSPNAVSPNLVSPVAVKTALSAPGPSASGAGVSAPLAPGFLVQLGLFRSASGIRTLERRLSDGGFAHENTAVTIRGVEYSRIRVGPFPTKAAARDKARELDTMFRLKSAIVAVGADGQS